MVETHTHKPIIGKGVIRCQTCDKFLDSAEEEILVAQSAIRAKRVQDEIAIAGGYTASGHEGDSVVYAKVLNGLTMEIVVRKVKDLEYVVIKRARVREKMQDTS